LHNNGPFWVKGTLILDAPVVSPGALLLVSFTCSWILSRIYVCFLVLPFFFLGFARNCCVNCNWFDSFAFVPIHEHGSFFASFSNLHFSCCESRVLMEILLTVSMSLTSQLWITLTSKITRFRWGILLFLSNAFSFYNSKFFIWLAPFFFSLFPLVQTWISNNHGLLMQMKPNFHPEGHPFGDNKVSSNSKPITQLWHENGRCPEGTIPVRRTSKNDILRSSSIQQFGKKKPRSFPKPKPAKPLPDIISQSGHQVQLLLQCMQ